MLLGMAFLVIKRRETSPLVSRLFLYVPAVSVTVMVQVMVKPFTVVAVIMAVPAAFAVTVPSAATSTIPGASLLQVMLLSVALSGGIDAVSFEVSPTAILKVL